MKYTIYLSLSVAIIQIFHHQVNGFVSKEHINSDELKPIWDTFEKFLFVLNMNDFCFVPRGSVDSDAFMGYYFR